MINGTVKQNMYLILSPKFGHYEIGGSKVHGLNMPRITKGSPSLNKNEVAIKLNIEVPKKLFETPSLKADITVPSSAITDNVVSADVKENIMESIVKNSDLNISVVFAEDEDL